MRVDSKQKGECCGCTACASVCPHDAITMQADDLGFLYPQIDDARCVDCGLCVKVCQFGADYARVGKWLEPEVFAVRLKDEEQLRRSQSGGAFYGMAIRMLERGGVVYGAGFTGHFHVAHKRVTTMQELEELRGSKYVQSDMRDVFPQVKADLRAGRPVLFSGTPCQVSGLQSYVGVKMQSQLYTVDLVCHGVPSPAVWHDYLDYVERKEGEPCTGVNFRDKSFGWGSHEETFCFASGRKITRSTYRYLFYKHYMLRDSCFQCPYTNLKRCSDITVADFWGWPKVGNGQFDDNKGVSLVLVNSDKGKELLDEARSTFHLIKSNTTDCLQPQLQHPSLRNRLSCKFLSYYRKKDFAQVLNRFGDRSLRAKQEKAIRQVKDIIKKIIFR